MVAGIQSQLDVTSGEELLRKTSSKFGLFHMQLGLGNEILKTPVKGKTKIINFNEL